MDAHSLLYLWLAPLRFGWFLSIARAREKHFFLEEAAVVSSATISMMVPVVGSSLISRPLGWR